MSMLGLQIRGVSIWRVLVCMVLWSITGVLTAGGIYSLYIQNIPPVVVTGQVDQYGEAHPGGLMSIHVQFHRDRDCPIDQGIYLQKVVNLDGRDVVQKLLLENSNTVAVDVTGPGSSEAILSWVLPSNVPPGEWDLRIKSIDRCGLVNILFPSTRNLQTTVLIQPR